MSHRDTSVRTMYQAASAALSDRNQYRPALVARPLTPEVLVRREKEALIASSRTALQRSRALLDRLRGPSAVTVRENATTWEQDILHHDIGLLLWARECGLDELISPTLNTTERRELQAEIDCLKEIESELTQRLDLISLHPV